MPPQTAWIVQKAFWRQEKAAFYAQNGVELSTQVTQAGYSAVDVELVAEYVAKNLLTDAGIIQRVVRQNRTLGQRIWQFINDLLGKLGFRNAKERAFLLRARSLYSAALQETQSSFRNDLQMRYNRMEADIAELLRRVEAGEISEEDARAAYDEIYDPEADMAHWGYDNEDNSFSIEKTTDNRPFVKIDEDILAGVPKEEWAKKIRALLTQKFKNGIQLWNNLIQVNQRSRRELTMSRASRVLEKKNPSILAEKFRAVTHADDVLHAATDWKSEKPKHERKDNLINFSRGNVLLQIGENQYTAEVVIGETAGHTLQLHEISNIKETTFDKKEGSTSAIPPFQGDNREISPSVNSISQVAQNVNAEIQESKKWTTQYSISPNLENELLEVLKDTFEKRRNEVYIGTTSNFLTKLLGVDSIPVTMPPRKAYAAMVSEARARADIRFHRDLNYHELGLNGLMRALEASENPVAVFAARPDGKEKRANSLVLVTNETMRGKNIVVVEAIETKGRLNQKKIEANKVVTAYDRGAVMADLMEAYADNRLLYLDKKRSQEILAGGNASNSRTAIQRINTDFTNNIANFLANVKWEKQENKKFLFETPTATKTQMQLAMEKAQRKAAEKERQHSYSPKTTEEKRDIVGAFRQFLNGEIDKAALREKIGTDKIGTALDTNLWTGQREYLPSGTDTMAERVVRDAHKEGISVDEYLRQNAEHYTDENGEYNKIAMTAIALERKEISPDGSYSSAEIRQAIEDVCGPLQAYPAIEEGRLDFVKYDKKRRAALWQIFSTATSAKNNPYDEETGNKVLQEKTALKSKTEE